MPSPIPAAPVPPPDAEEVNDAAAAGSASVVEILGDGCNPGELNQGTGFVVAEGYVVTNAHVVAGTEHQFVDDGTGDPAHRHPAEVVEFDTALDIAVLFVPDWDAPALELETGEVDRGTGGAVLGLAGEFPLKVVSAAVLSTIDGTGTDTFGNDEITRRLYELQAEIRPGDSGAPFVLPNGRVAGVVFAASRLDDGVGYAIVAAQVEPVVEDGVGDRSPVSSLGDCVI
jgi:S1-C subfamily serine protease